MIVLREHVPVKNSVQVNASGDRRTIRIFINFVLMLLLPTLNI
jgi:hypothetical protein